MASLSQLIGPLDGEGRQPLYQQLQRALRAAIDQNILAPDDALPDAGFLVERRGFLAELGDLG